MEIFSARNISAVVIFLLFLIGVVPLVGCSYTNESSIESRPVEAMKMKKISPEAAKEQMDKNKNSILLDVRTEEEYEEIHIPESILIPLDTLEASAEEQMIDKSIPIFIYCRSGRRSVTAAQILLELGYTEVYDLGGIIDWPYETKSKKP